MGGCCLLLLNVPATCEWISGTDLLRQCDVRNTYRQRIFKGMAKERVWRGATSPSSWGWGCLLVGCLTSQQHASVTQGRICSDKFTCCHTEIEVADQTSHLTQSQYTDTRLNSPSADPITPGVWQGSH